MVADQYRVRIAALLTTEMTSRKEPEKAAQSLEVCCHRSRAIQLIALGAPDHGILEQTRRTTLFDKAEPKDLRQNTGTKKY